MIISTTVRAWLYVIPNAFSVLCSIFVLYHLLRDRQLRQALHNHVIIILLLANLLFELTDVVWIIHYYFTGETIVKNPTFVLIWVYINYSCFYLEVLLFAWATIERYFLVFHDRWFNTLSKRLILHYFPICLLLVYCYGYYAVLIFAPFCTNYFNYLVLFGLPLGHCMYWRKFIVQWDLMFNQVVPAFTIVVFSMALLIRVLWQKRRMLQSINWRKQRRMIYQLLSITLIYLIFNIPCSLYYLAYQTGLATVVHPEISFYLAFFAFYLAFLFPFACLGTLPNFRQKLRRLFCLRRQTGVIQPSTVNQAPHLQVFTKKMDD